MKRLSRKLALHRETLTRLEDRQIHAQGAARSGETCVALCTWVSELYTACTCPPTWPGCQEP